MTEQSKDRWLSWVSLTTALLAVCTAIATLAAGKNSTRMQLMATDEANAWAFFQSKSIKQHSCEVARDLIEVESALTSSTQMLAVLDRKLQTYRADIGRYDREKSEIKSQAEDLAAKEKEAKNRSLHFTMAVVFMQIAIMLSSTAALLRKKPAWVVGMVFWVVGVAFFANAFYLWVE
jgi:hypothetical protein